MTPQDTPTPSSDPAAAPTDPSKPPRRKVWLRRLVMLLGFAVIALGLLVGLGVPLAVSSDWARERFEREAGRALHTEVALGSMAYGWFDGLTLEGLRVRNPEGFDPSRELLRVDRIAGEFSLLSVLRGAPELLGSVEGLEVRVEEDADGYTNMDAIAGRTREDVARGPAPEEPTEDDDRDPRDTPVPGEGPSREDFDIGSDWYGLQMDLRVSDGDVEMWRQGALVHAMRNVEAAVAKPASRKRWARFCTGSSMRKFMPMSAGQG